MIATQSPRGVIVAFIPARGGSRRLPRKNLLPLAGRPLLAHAIALAHAVPAIDLTVVSTDDDEIAAVAAAAGADVIRRPAELAHDTATTASAAVHALKVLEQRGHNVDTLVTLQPTCPLRSPALVNDALSLFQLHRPDTVVSVSPVPAKHGTVRDGVYRPEYTPGTRSQDLETTFAENGLVYVTDASTVRLDGELFSPVLRALVCDGSAALGDIDTAADLEVAERLYLAGGRPGEMAIVGSPRMSP